MKNNKKQGVTIIELIICITMLSVVLILLYSLINNLNKKKSENDSSSDNILKINEFEQMFQENVMGSLNYGNKQITNAKIALYNDYILINVDGVENEIIINNDGLNSAISAFDSKWKLNEKTCMVSDKSYRNQKFVMIFIECKSPDHNATDYIKLPLYFFNAGTIAFTNTSGVESDPYEGYCKNNDGSLVEGSLSTYDMDMSKGNTTEELSAIISDGKKRNYSNFSSTNSNYSISKVNNISYDGTTGKIKIKITKGANATSEDSTTLYAIYGSGSNQCKVKLGTLNIDNHDLCENIYGGISHDSITKTNYAGGSVQIKAYLYNGNNNAIGLNSNQVIFKPINCDNKNYSISSTSFNNLTYDEVKESTVTITEPATNAPTKTCQFQVVIKPTNNCEIDAGVIKINRVNWCDSLEASNKTSNDQIVKPDKNANIMVQIYNPNTQNITASISGPSNSKLVLAGSSSITVSPGVNTYNIPVQFKSGYAPSKEINETFKVNLTFNSCSGTDNNVISVSGTIRTGPADDTTPPIVSIDENSLEETFNVGNTGDIIYTAKITDDSKISEVYSLVYIDGEYKQTLTYTGCSDQSSCTTYLTGCIFGNSDACNNSKSIINNDLSKITKKYLVKIVSFAKDTKGQTFTVDDVKNYIKALDGSGTYTKANKDIIKTHIGIIQATLQWNYKLSISSSGLDREINVFNSYGNSVSSGYVKRIGSTNNYYVLADDEYVDTLQVLLSWKEGDTYCKSKYVPEQCSLTKNGTSYYCEINVTNCLSNNLAVHGYKFGYVLISNPDFQNISLTVDGKGSGSFFCGGGNTGCKCTDDKFGCVSY